MSGLGKVGKVKGRAKLRLSRARLKVVAVFRDWNGNCDKRVGAGASIYLSAVMKNLAAGILELAGNAVRDNKKTRILPRRLQPAIRNDEKLNQLLAGILKF